MTFFYPTSLEFGRRKGILATKKPAGRKTELTRQQVIDRIGAEKLRGMEEYLEGITELANRNFIKAYTVEYRWTNGDTENGSTYCQFTSATKEEIAAWKAAQKG